ncbi:Uncharacterised protein [Bordetella pertussis]|nr:Uncharacterised protein [Bordetella pertussis]
MSSQKYSTCWSRPSRPAPRRVSATRLSKARTSSSSKALPSDSMGTAWRTLPNSASGAAPTRCVGESGVTSSGCSASSACRSRMSASYSASGTLGSSWT